MTKTSQKKTKNTKTNQKQTKDIETNQRQTKNGKNTVQQYLDKQYLPEKCLNQERKRDVCTVPHITRDQTQKITIDPGPREETRL